MSTTGAGARTIVSAQVSQAERAELLRRAEDADRTLSAEIRRAIREHLECEHLERGEMEATG